MDLAVNSSMSGTETQHVPYDGGHMNNETAAQRRHVRYTSPDASTPRRMNEAGTSNSVRSSPNGDSGFATMSRASPAISPFVISQVLQEPESSNTGPLPEVNGQNHDRMETDMESEGSQSENQSSEAVEELVPPHAAESPAQLEDGEIMDTTPDSPAAFDVHAPLEAGGCTCSDGIDIQSSVADMLCRPGTGNVGRDLGPSVSPARQHPASVLEREYGWCAGSWRSGVDWCNARD